MSNFNHSESGGYSDINIGRSVIFIKDQNKKLKMNASGWMPRPPSAINST